MSFGKLRARAALSIFFFSGSGLLTEMGPAGLLASLESIGFDPNSVFLVLILVN